MSVKTTLNASQGMVQTNNAQGVVVEKNSNNAGFAPFPQASVTAITAAGTASAGTNTISGSSALTIVLPLASSNAGAMFTFRNLSAHAHILTASVDTALQTVSDTATSGTRITMSASVGKSVSLLCDGRAYNVFAAYSASYTIAG